MKIQYGDDNLDIHAIIMLKDKERCLDEKFGVASTFFCPDASSYKRALAEGYEVLCFVFDNGSMKFIVKPEQLIQAERIAMAVDRKALSHN